MTEETRKQSNARLVAKLMVAVVAMFVFAVGILPPMYDAICDITGLNGKTASEAADTSGAQPDAERTVTIQFLADTDPDMVWDFKPNVFSVKVHPGEIRQVDFHVRNPSQRVIVGQAIPSVSPGQASPYFKKTECFCFNNQELAGGQEADLPLIFYVDPELPKSVTTITLSYQLYDITGADAEDPELAANY
ncbi:MAG: cytochrome c oxidase assembly protein [Pseudomonadales bacterium]|nr:cytochrome c oxidase assembly protein [Pseudomonadales bacterium]